MAKFDALPHSDTAKMAGKKNMETIYWIYWTCGGVVNMVKNKYGQE